MAYRFATRLGLFAGALPALALFAASCGDNWPAQTNAMGGSGGSQQTGGIGGGANDGGMSTGGTDASPDGAAGIGGETGTGGIGGAPGTGGAAGSGGSAGTGGSGTGGQAGTGGMIATGGVGGSTGGTGGSTGGTGGSTGGVGGGTGGVGGSTGGVGGSTGGMVGSGGTGGTAGMGGMGGCQSATDCQNGQICDGATNTCVPCPSDSACRSGYGPQHVCVSGACIPGECQTFDQCSNGRLCVNYFCADCASDTDCHATYGNDHLCVSGGCVAGICRSASDCNAMVPGQICAPDFQCTDCTTDDQCVSGYGANHLCVNGLCVSGNCRSTAACTGGRICDTSALMCVPCTDDANCMANYPGPQLCLNGSCTAGNCRSSADCTAGLQVCDLSSHMCTACANDTACVSAYGANHLCVGGSCVVGECRTANDCKDGELGDICNSTTHMCNACAADADCVTAYGTNHLCINNVCVSGTCHTTTPDCGGGEICDATTHTCGQCASDNACVTAYGPQHLCVNNVCVSGQCRVSKDCLNGALCDTTTFTCHACASDAACQADPSYGVTDVCIGGACSAGDCHSSSAECPTGQLCGISHVDTCGACSSDAQCVNDSVYGSGYICYQGLCQPGDCHGTSADCTGSKVGQVCGAVTSNDCGLCSSDSQCQSDPYYGSSRMCQTAGGPTAGTCVSAACSTSGACSANPGDFCCNNICTPGNCCSDTDCASLGSTYRCVNNSCTGCSAATGNTYFVDPVNGSDASATGSGMAGGIATPTCSFKTVTHALAVVSGIGASGTKIVIVGQAGQTVALDVSETLPIVVPANVAISTKVGPIRVNLPAATDTAYGGFRLVGDQSVIAPDPSAPLTIDGNLNSSGIGIGVAPGAGKTAAISYVTVQNTGGNGIAVTSGTLNILQGVTVTNAGSTTRHHDGLNISGGTVNVTVPAGQATTSFSNNSEHGIYVTGTGVLNVNGVPVTTPGANGQGTVIANSNAFDGLEIFQAAGAAAQSSITGLVAWANIKQGIQLFGGEKVKVRRCVLLNNKLNGLFLTAADSTAASNDLSGINLGTAGDPGLNQLQASLGSNADLAGLCVSMAASQGALSLAAEGNTFAGPTDCTTSTNSIVRSSTCANNVDIGVVPASGTTVTVDAAGCQ